MDENLTVPSELVDSIRSGDCVLFAGAGLSARAGIPTWDRFLYSLLGFARLQQIVDADLGLSLEEALAQGDRDSVADGLIQAFGERRNMLQDFVRQSFPDTAQLTPAHEWLRQISFAAVVTTNYDTLFEKAFPEFAKEGLFTPSDAESLLDALSQKRRFMLKLYGTIDRPDTLIFAPIEYREAISSNVSFSKFVEGFFFSRNFLFVGLSLEGIQDFLSGFVFRGVNTRKHFALVAVTGTAWKAKARFLERRYNVKVIDYPVSDTFPEFDTFVEQLSFAARPTAANLHEHAAPPVTLAPGIRKVILEDIGCFERLELDFPQGQNWKILLGDNGVGKSTVLKAIATAIIGSDAKSYAGRLVRAGKTRGRITLITAQNPHGYITDILTKDMVSEAEVVSIPTRCMEAEGWLALGFSPLRIMTWSQSSGPQTILQKGRPTADDLVPLLAGEGDPRMDRLKQWIVNLDAADKPLQVRSFTGHTERVTALAFGADGRTLISGSIDQTVRSWDSWNGQELWKANAHTGGVNAVALSKDGQTVVSGSFDRTAKSWKADSGSYLQKFVGNHSQVLTVALSSDGRWLVTGSEGGSIRIWDRNAGVSGSDSHFGSVTETRWIPSEGGSVWSVALSGDGRILAAATEAGTIRICEVETGKILRTIGVEGGGVWCVAMSDDGKTLVSGSENGSVKVWDVERGIELRTLQNRRSAGIQSVAMSADGKTAVMGAENGRIKVWDVVTGRQLLATQAHKDGVWAVALSPDGRTLASASSNITLWSLPESNTTLRQQETIRKFFRIIGELTDRQDTEFLRVTDDFRVMVKVAEVPNGIPLEVLSQGMTSLLGWIGVLCQRLRETLQNPGSDPLPTDAYALVLIDELDAHMHPKWQQVLVHRLKKVFPNAQFIACTHSPLIVSGLEKSEIDRFAVLDGKVAKIDFDSDMTLGRADQILSGELFALPSTLDVVTQDLMVEYEALLGMSKRNDDQEKRFLKLGAMLEARIPPSPSNPVERRARELLETLQSLDRIANDDPWGAEVRDRMSRLSKALSGQGGV